MGTRKSQRDTSMIRYVAFLRGINVGGQKVIKMTDLARLFESFGFEQVKTYIASGNVLFDTAEANADVIRGTEEGLRAALGYDVRVILRTIAEIEGIIKMDPFKDVAPAEHVRLYVTFLSEEPRSTLKLPYESSAGEFQILQRKGRDVFSAVFLSEMSRSVDGMTFIEKEFGTSSTTRNWNTVRKIAAL